jgi:hypothetical protein
LRNLVNEAALLAARKEAAAVRAEDFAEALQKITLGPARNILLSPADRERTARRSDELRRGLSAGAYHLRTWWAHREEAWPHQLCGSSG